MTLEKLLGGVGVTDIKADGNFEVAGMKIHSDEVSDGDLFFV